MPDVKTGDMAIKHGMSEDEMNQMDLKVEVQRSKPDFIVYEPKSIDGSTGDTGNEHFLMFDGPDNDLMAVWTQSTYEGAGDHRIMFTRSNDQGQSWSTPRHLVGCEKKGVGRQASWAFPMVSIGGRVYIVYNQYQDITDYHHQITGTMDCIYSDDSGESWSAPQTIPMPHSAYDHPDTSVPSNWIVWQKPIRDLEGTYFTGFTRWVSPKVRTPPHDSTWKSAEAVTQFMRFLNIDDNPDPRDIEVWYSPDTEALRVPHYAKPALSIAQEPSIVILPDSRMFCVMRSMTGYVWYSVSSDNGSSWCVPRPLLNKDFGLPIQAPLTCTPLYSLSGGRFILVRPDNNGFIGAPDQTQAGTMERRPACYNIGEFRPNAEQPVWFSETTVLMDNDGVKIGPLGRLDIGVYPSMTTVDGQDVLWHPDRKFFLLGKIIPKEMASTAVVPE